MQDLPAISATLDGATTLWLSDWALFICWSGSLQKPLIRARWRRGEERRGQTVSNLVSKIKGPSSQKSLSVDKCVDFYVICRCDSSVEEICYSNLCCIPVTRKFRSLRLLRTRNVILARWPISQRCWCWETWRVFCTFNWISAIHDIILSMQLSIRAFFKKLSDDSH